MESLVTFRRRKQSLCQRAAEREFSICVYPDTMPARRIRKRHCPAQFFRPSSLRDRNNFSLTSSRGQSALRLPQPTTSILLRSTIEAVGLIRRDFLQRLARSIFLKRCLHTVSGLTELKPLMERKPHLWLRGGIPAAAYIPAWTPERLGASANYSVRTSKAVAPTDERSRTGRQGPNNWNIRCHLRQKATSTRFGVNAQ